MIRVDTAAQDFEAVSAFVMSSVLAVSGGASTAVEGLYLVSVLERTCKEFLSRCVGRLGMNTVKASRARKREARQHRESLAGIVRVSLVAALRYSVGCARRNYAWLHCRATSLLTSSSCPWSTDPETKRMTAECELLPPVDFGKSDHSAFEGTELVSGATDLSPGMGLFGLSATRRIPTLRRAWIFVASLIRRGITGRQIALKVTSWPSSGSLHVSSKKKKFMSLPLTFFTFFFACWLFFGSPSLRTPIIGFPQQ